MKHAKCISVFLSQKMKFSVYLYVFSFKAICCGVCALASEIDPRHIDCFLLPQGDRPVGGAIDIFLRDNLKCRSVEMTVFFNYFSKVYQVTSVMFGGCTTDVFL